MFRCFLLATVLVSFVKGDAVNFHYNNTYKYDETYTVSVSKTDEYILEFGGNEETYDTPARVHVASVFANTTYPVFITARQQKGVLSWQLPMTVQIAGSLKEFSNVSRTLCPHNNLFNYQKDSCESTTINTPTIHLSTSSPDHLTVNIKVETVHNFYIKLNEGMNDYGNMSKLNYTYDLEISPSEPMYYFYSFGQSKNLSLDALKIQKRFACDKMLREESERMERSLSGSGRRDWPDGLNGVVELRSDWSERGGGWFGRPKTVILMIESDNDICAVVSIQNFSCPVFDNERDILYDGQYLTMTQAGGITLTEEQFPLGFYIVFIVKSSDEDCAGSESSASSNGTSGPVGFGFLDVTSDTVRVTKDGRTKMFRFAVVATISYRDYAYAATLVFGFFIFFYFAFIINMCRCRRNTVHMAESAQSQEDLIAPSVPHDQSSTSILVTEQSPSIQGLVEGRENTLSYVVPHEESDADSELSILADIDTDREMYILPSRLCVASLARVRSHVLRARSNLYTWSVLTVAVFYTLPVVQLVFTYQRLLNQSGNQDLCYYNFLCSHPLGLLSDFNHVYSNIGYVMLGALFLLQVYRRHLQDNRSREEKELGIPQHYGLLYAMGIALVSEGLLSGSYHVCPNDMNFQFDTSFMYVTAVLCMVKIYQSRHPDINARAHATFGVLALIIFIGLVGVLNSSIYFWVLFTLIHISTCFILTFKIYYLGRFRFDGNILCRAARELVSTPIAAITPTYCGRMVLLILVNLANWALAAYGMYYHNKDFASHLLVIMMGNLFLYTNFYVIMKLLHRERITLTAWLFFLLTHATWYTAAYFFLQQSTDWALTPAQSRQYNRVCSLLHLYDSHDVWHLLSAVAMFFSFNMYMTIDDNLYQTSRTKIMVF